MGSATASLISERSQTQKPLVWAIVGYGWVARDHMAPALRSAGHHLSTICDPDPAVRTLAEEQGLHAVATLEEMVQTGGYDAAYIATPNHLHRAGVEALAKARIPVLCEKPMAASLEDAQAMVRITRETGTPFGTAFDQRFHPAHEAIREKIATGALGTITAIRIVYACWLGRDWCAASPPSLSLSVLTRQSSPQREIMSLAQDPGVKHRDDSKGGSLPLNESSIACGERELHSNWRIDPRKAGGGALMDLAPHGLDLVDALLGEPLIEIKAFTQNCIHDYAVDDGALLIGRTGSGVLVQIHVAYNHPEHLPRRRLEVVGVKGQIVAENTMGQEAGGSVVFIDAMSGERHLIPFAATSPFEAEAKAFAGFLSGEQPRAFDAERDLHVMRLIDQAYREADPCR